MDVPRALQMLGLCRTHCCATWFVEVEAVGRCVVASAVQLAEVKQMLSSSGTGEHQGCAVVPFVRTALPEAVLLASAHPLCCYCYCWLVRRETCGDLGWSRGAVVAFSLE
jgi:hypothetical protein